MNSKKIEQQALIVGIFVNLLMCCAGIVVYEITHIEALFIDAYFSVITFSTGIFSFTISKISSKKRTNFPNGLFALEPLYSLFQSLLTICLLFVSLTKVGMKAYKYFIYGQGSLMNVGPVVPYEIVMLVLSFGLSYYYHLQNRRINGMSTMLFSETKGTLVDELMSLGIGLFAFVLSFIDQDSPLGFLKYTGDFFMTALLVSFAIRLPIQVIKRAFTEVCGGLVLDQHIQQSIEACIKKYLFGGLLIKKCLVYKIGMSFRIYVLISSKTKYINNGRLSKIKTLVLKELSKKLSFVNLEFCLC